LATIKKLNRGVVTQDTDVAEVNYAPILSSNSRSRPIMIIGRSGIVQSQSEDNIFG
jgi:hypothetical protein